jgi:sulfur carrier protein ThiS adenylyltransferase
MTFTALKDRLSGFTVGIAGCGGLGSNCAVALARVGIGRLVIADFDVVSESNLNRQYYFTGQVGLPKVKALTDNLLSVNPLVVVEAHEIRLDPAGIMALFGCCDVVVEAFDLASEKEMLVETMLTGYPGKPLVLGLGMAGWGMSNTIRCRQDGNLFICGDGETEIGPEMPPLAPRVGMVANMQANTVVEILLNSAPTKQ